VLDAGAEDLGRFGAPKESNCQNLSRLKSKTGRLANNCFVMNIAFFVALMGCYHLSGQ